MDKSAKRILNRRAILLNNKSIPAHHEAILNLESFLGETALNEMSPIAREMMGIDTPFPVAPKTLWIDPNDRNENNIMLKPPPNEEVIKALTHDGILEIGNILEEKLEKQCQSRIKAAKKEVEEFERFECNNRIKFAVEQERIAHNEALKQQRQELLKMFQKDREELIEESKIELETMKNNLLSEHNLMKEKEIQLSLEKFRNSSNNKINELNKEIYLLKNEIENTRKMVNSEVEKRKKQDWQLLHEMFVEIHRQFTTKLTYVQHQHNAEIRQMYLEHKANAKIESEQTTTYNDDSLWEDGSEVEQEKIDFNEENKPFFISVCKVEGESSEEEMSPKLDAHSTGSSFKCYKHTSKTKKNTNFDEQNLQDDPLETKIIYTESLAASIPDPNDINTTDISCNILRRLGLNFNSANIEKIKLELDDLLLKVNKGEQTKLLTAMDSLDLITDPIIAPIIYPRSTAALLGTSDSRELLLKKKSDDLTTDEYRRIVNRRKSQKVIDSKLAIPLTGEEYANTLAPIPKYMKNNCASISIWDYKAMSEEEWNNLLQELDNKLRAESAENISKNKTVTMTEPNSMDFLAVSKISHSNRNAPVRGILRPSIENKADTESLLQNDVFQTDEMQSLVNKLCQ